MPKSELNLEMDPFLRMGKFLIDFLNLACFRLRNERLFRHHSAAHMDDDLHLTRGHPRDVHL